MKKLIAILACKLVRLVGKLVGRGSSMPGSIALKICPDILSRVQLPEHIIAVTGSNGKTSTVEMIAAVLRADGKRIIYNEEGSNQTEGVTTLVLSHCTLGGKVKADVLLLESDERYARYTFRYFHPTEFVITNLYRDQLTRNGHPEFVYNAVAEAIFPDSTLILNADDPLSSCLGRGHEKTVWYGIEPVSFDTKEPCGIYHDGTYCPICKAPMEYDYYHYNHMGSYHCSSCGHARPAPQYTITSIDMENESLVLDGTYPLSMTYCSVYKCYNVLAAYAACRVCGIPAETVLSTLNGYVLKNGRRKEFQIGGHNGTLLTSKHENSMAYDTNFRYIAEQKAPCSVLIIVDAISRKYYTSETSWLWDIDFNLLDRDHIQKIYLIGLYADDLAERLSFTSIPEEKIIVEKSIDKAAEMLKASGDEYLYLTTCFSDRDKFLTHTTSL